MWNESFSSSPSSKMIQSESINGCENIDWLIDWSIGWRKKTIMKNRSNKMKWNEKCETLTQIPQKQVWFFWIDVHTKSWLKNENM